MNENKFIIQQIEKEYNEMIKRNQNDFVSISTENSKMNFIFTIEKSSIESKKSSLSWKNTKETINILRHYLTQKNKFLWLLPIQSTDFLEEKQKREISYTCQIPYQCTLKQYFSENDCQEDELFRHLLRIIEIYDIVNTRLKVPVSLSIDDLSFAMITKSSRIPHPEIVLTPFAFFKVFNDSTSQSNIHYQFASVLSLIAIQLMKKKEDLKKYISKESNSSSLTNSLNTGNNQTQQNKQNQLLKNGNKSMMKTRQLKSGKIEMKTKSSIVFS